MTATTIRRGAANRGKAGGGGRAKANLRGGKRNRGAMRGALAGLPISQAGLQRILLAAIFAAAGAIAWGVAVLAGLPELAGERLVLAAAEAGYEVRRVEIRGIRQMDEVAVYERVLAQKDRAMPQVDIAGLREQLLELSWVEDARVSRQLPDTLVVDIAERKPAAVIRKGGRLVLIDRAGNELEAVSEARAKGMLVLSGDDAGQQAAGLSALLAAAPALEPQVREAEWIGHRRWNLIFKTGQILALPEGDGPATEALVAFARMDGVNRLLGGQVASFDMRSPDRIYLRVPGSGAQRSAAVQVN